MYNFADTPNNGGVYKVWATPVLDFVGDATKVDNDCGVGCYHGFVPSKSKTDNFKAKTGTPTFCLQVTKQIRTVATDGTHITPGSFWQIDVTDPLLITNNYYTDTFGNMQVCGLGEGAYMVSEVIKLDFSVVGLFVNGISIGVDSVYSFTWTAAKPTPFVIIFQNQGSSNPPPL